MAGRQVSEDTASLDQRRGMVEDRLWEHRRLVREPYQADLFAWVRPEENCQHHQEAIAGTYGPTLRLRPRNMLSFNTTALLTRLGSVNSTYAYLHAPISVICFYGQALARLRVLLHGNRQSSRRYNHANEAFAYAHVDRILACDD